MAITLFAVAANPVDGVTLYDSVERSITPPASMVAGDLVILRVDRKALNTITMVNDGGQSWNVGTLRQGGSNSARIYWCRYNGTWTNNPSIQTMASATTVISLKMIVARPTSGSNTWAVDAAEAWHPFSAPVSPFDVTATGRTTVAASTFCLASWQSVDTNTWGLQTAGWTNAGTAQYRNPDASTARPISTSDAYKILTSAGATGSPVNRQLTNGGDLGLWIFNAWKEQSAGVTISAVSDGLIYDGETGITVTGTSFGASHTGSANVIISPTNNIADGSAVVQTQTSWSDTSVQFTANLSSFSAFTTLYLFVKNSSGAANSSGFPIKREARMHIADDLENLAGTPYASQSGLHYRVTKTLNGTAFLSGTNETTDGSAEIDMGYYTLTEGGELEVDDPVLISLVKPGATADDTVATLVAYDPDYV